MKKILLLSLVFFLFSFLRAEAWTRDLTFESGSAGLSAQGTNDSFTGAGANVTFDNTRAHSGSKSSKIHWVANGTDNFQTAGGFYEFPAAGLSNLSDGDEIWYRAYWYSPSDFDFCGANNVKQMRISPLSGGSGGQHSIMALGDNFSWVCEMPDYGCLNWDVWKDCDGSGPWVPGTSRPIPKGRWFAWEIYVKFVPGSGGIVRVWEDGELLVERYGDVFMSGDQIFRTQIAGVWNGGPCKNQDQWVDDIVITTDTPSGRDAKGNPMIGITSGGGSCTPSCSGRSCGDNGCGGSCGTCSSGQNCTNYQCVSQTCTPSWQCDAWSACSNNSQTRTCTDSNNCGVNTGKPATNQSCTSSCTPSWQCSNWNACSNSSQSRTCTDSNNCGTTSGKPATTQSCQSAPDPVEVDSTYSGYSKDKIDDNVINAQGGESSTWASGESSTDPHWIELNFTSPKTLNYLDIYWAFNSYRNAFATSQEVQVQKWNGSSYETIATVTNSSSQEKSSVSFSSITTSKLRLYQPANKGYADYSTVMWVAEVDYGMGSVVERKYNNNDFSSLVTDWLQTKTSSADINSDGTVNTRDLGIMMSKWGS